MKNDIPELELLPAFVALADAAINATNAIWEKILPCGYKGETVQVLAKSLNREISAIKRAGDNWIVNRRKHKFALGQHIKDVEAPDRLSRLTAKKPSDVVLKEIIRHHETSHGGEPWMLLRRDRIVPVDLDRSKAPYYRFRLASLARLAVQCGSLSSTDYPEILDNERPWDDDE